MNTETKHASEWYVANTGNHQGLIIEEKTGRNIAVAYDKSDAPLIASAPDMAKEIAQLKWDLSASNRDGNDLSEIIAQLKADKAELVASVAELIEPQNDEWYCDYCDRHAPKDPATGRLTGEKFHHHETCPIVKARNLIAKHSKV